MGENGQRGSFKYPQFAISLGQPKILSGSAE